MPTAKVPLDPNGIGQLVEAGTAVGKALDRLGKVDHETQLSVSSTRVFLKKKLITCNNINHSHSETLLYELPART